MGTFTEAAGHRKSGTPCFVCLALAESDEADDIQAALDDSSVTGQAIKRGLMALGYKAGDGAVGKHRRRECSGLK